MESVEAAGWASIAGLRKGDLIIKINNKTIKDITLFQKEMDLIVKRKADNCIFFIKRGIHSLFLELEPDWK